MVDPNELEPMEADRWLAQVAATEVLTLDGQRVRLREYWRDAPTVTSFLRHFGCLFCHQMVADVVRTVPRILSKNANVVLVGNGSIDQAERFFRSKGLPSERCHVVTDPARESYKAAEFQCGYAKTFAKPSRAAYRAARKEGHKIVGLFGDLTQLGGVLVTRPPARFMYLHRSSYAGDHPDMDLVLRAVDQAHERAAILSRT